jgi:hypothetical protein
MAFCSGVKNNLDQLYQLYTAFEIPTYLIFDNDIGGNEADLLMNEKLLQMLGEEPQREPRGRIMGKYAIFERNFEDEMKKAIGEDLYSELKLQAFQLLGKGAGKGLVARYMARVLTDRGIVPPFIKAIVRAIQRLEEVEKDLKDEELDIWDDEIPF